MYGLDKLMGDHWTKSLRSRGLHHKAKPSGTAGDRRQLLTWRAFCCSCEKT